MKTFIYSLVATVAFAAAVAPGAIAADLADVGYIDQAAVGSLPPFASANAQLAQYKAQLDQQFKGAMQSAKSDADKQRVTLQFQQQLQDKQNELVGPLVARAQLAIAQVSASKNLSIVVDKRIIVYGGQDITKEVIGAFASSKALVQPAASPPPATIGFVDQSAFGSIPKMKSASDQMSTFASEQQKIFAQKLNGAKTDVEKQQIASDFNKTLKSKQNELVKPIVDQTLAVTADVAKKKGLLLVLDRADIVYGGMDITQDVQSALTK